MHVPGSRLGEYCTRWTFTDSVRMNLAAVLISLNKKKNEKIAQNHIAMFSTRFYHILTCIYTVLLIIKPTF